MDPFVLLYTTDELEEQSNRLRLVLEQSGVPFEEVNVSESPGRMMLCRVAYPVLNSR